MILSYHSFEFLIENICILIFSNIVTIAALVYWSRGQLSAFFSDVEKQHWIGLSILVLISSVVYGFLLEPYTVHAHSLNNPLLNARALYLGKDIGLDVIRYGATFPCLLTMFFPLAGFTPVPAVFLNFLFILIGVLSSFWLAYSLFGSGKKGLIAASIYALLPTTIVFGPMITGNFIVIQAMVAASLATAITAYRTGSAKIHLLALSILTLTANFKSELVALIPLYLLGLLLFNYSPVKSYISAESIFSRKKSPRNLILPFLLLLLLLIFSLPALQNVKVRRGGGGCTWGNSPEGGIDGILSPIDSVFRDLTNPEVYSLKYLPKNIQEFDSKMLIFLLLAGSLSMAFSLRDNFREISFTAVFLIGYFLVYTAHCDYPGRTHYHIYQAMLLSVLLVPWMAKGIHELWEESRIVLFLGLLLLGAVAFPHYGAEIRDLNRTKGGFDQLDSIEESLEDVPRDSLLIVPGSRLSNYLKFRGYNATTYISLLENKSTWTRFYTEDELSGYSGRVSVGNILEEPHFANIYQGHLFKPEREAVYNSSAYILRTNRGWRNYVFSVMKQKYDLKKIYIRNGVKLYRLENQVKRGN